jgi:nucleotide-binding universal stress UspA family protein
MANLMQTIVVAYDDPGSETLERAAQLAQALGSSLIVTNVAAAAEGTEVDPAEQEARGKLDEARSELEARGVTAEYVVTRGHPGEAVVKLASERGADLIVVGTRRKRFFERLVEGSVLQEVMRRSHCDVLVVG